MEFISVFDMLKIGVGPSSSHTLGPWRAAEQFVIELQEQQLLQHVNHVIIELYGSLSLTGKGHATDLAIILGLSNADPITIPIESIDITISSIKQHRRLALGNERIIDFDYDSDIIFHQDFLPFHANAVRFTAQSNEHTDYSSTFYSIGGGFVVKEDTPITNIINQSEVPYPIQYANQLLDYCKKENLSIAEIVLANEAALRDKKDIYKQLLDIWEVMRESIYKGCHTEGELPGGLFVKRRAYNIHKKLIGIHSYNNIDSWIKTIQCTDIKFREILKWVSCFALAVNEVNASLGRIVTAPTNGSAGVIPAVLMYYLTIENHQANNEHIQRFLLVAGEIGSIFKKGATISAAMGGCQAEIGVSSAMAAAALCELLGGTSEQVLIAAEIAMEHHLGLTCDPIGGLVQIPCIERNSMGALKAIHAAELALETDAEHAKVPLDKVIETMWETARDMSHKYKETSKGGLAVAVNMPNC